jgi:hypothetical protein
MRQVFDDNIVFYIKAQISNTNNSSKVYDNVLIIRDDNFNDFLNIIDEKEEIEEIKLKRKKRWS